MRIVVAYKWAPNPKDATVGADGVVVGSAALRAALQGRAALAALLKGLRRGLDG